MIGESYVMERIDAIWSSADDAQKRRYTGGLRSFSPEKSNIFSYSCPYEFKQTVGHLNSAQKHCVKAIGMESLLDLKCNLVCRTLVAELVKRIDPSSGDLVVHGSAFHLSAESFADVMGLRNGKQDMVVALDRPELVNDVLEIVAPKGSEISISKLRDYIVASQEGDDIFKVVFALYAYGTLLCPTATGTVNRDIIPQLQDSSVMWRIDWATRSIAHLLDGVQIYQTSGEEYFAGSMIYLQLFYCQKLAKKLYVITGDIPAYKYWSRNSVKWLIKWVANHGGFSCSLVLNFSEEDPVSAGKYMALWSELERNKDELERSKAELDRNKKMDLKVNELVEARVKVVLANYGIGEPDIGVKKKKARNPFGYKSDRVVDKGEQMGSVFAEAMCEDQDALDSSIWTDVRSPAKGDISTTYGKRQKVNLVGDVEENVNENPAKPASPKAPLRAKARPLDKKAKTASPKAPLPAAKAPPPAKKAKTTRRLSKVPAPETANAKLKWDAHIYKYMCCREGDDEDEYNNTKVADIGEAALTRNDLRCLRPREPLTGDVINAMADILLEDGSNTWYFPTWFDGCARSPPIASTLSSKEREHEWAIRTRNICRLDRFDVNKIGESKIFIPINQILDDEAEIGHWFLLYVDTAARVARVYDSLKGSDTYAVRQSMALDNASVLKHLDRVFPTEGIEFQKFQFHGPLFHFQQGKKSINDCGVIVTLHMRFVGREWNIPKYLTNTERQRIVVDIALSYQNSLTNAIRGEIRRKFSWSIEESALVPGAGPVFSIGGGPVMSNGGPTGAYARYNAEMSTGTGNSMQSHTILRRT